MVTYSLLFWVVLKGGGVDSYFIREVIFSCKSQYRGYKQNASKNYTTCCTSLLGVLFELVPSKQCDSLQY